MMEIKPLSKKIYETALNLKVEMIRLHFSGGSDEGYLDIELDGPYNDELTQFEADVEKWAWDVYSYNGGGDGTEYGDDITYDLNNKTAYTEQWWYERQESESGNEPFTVE
jgi:hypothetical protein